jgi:hypothetical protein
MGKLTQSLVRRFKTTKNFLLVGFTESKAFAFICARLRSIEISIRWINLVLRLTYFLTFKYSEKGKLKLLFYTLKF